MKAKGIELTKQIFDNHNPEYYYNMYFYPEDYGCRIFDFYKENDIRIYNGILPFKREVIKTITRDEFEKEFGQYIFYDTLSYRVGWRNNGYTWNN